VHIEIFAASRNTEDEARDKPVGIKHFFRGPYVFIFDGQAIPKKLNAILRVRALRGEIVFRLRK